MLPWHRCLPIELDHKYDMTRFSYSLDTKLDDAQRKRFSKKNVEARPITRIRDWRGIIPGKYPHVARNLGVTRMAFRCGCWAWISNLSLLVTAFANGQVESRIVRRFNSSSWSMNTTLPAARIPLHEPFEQHLHRTGPATPQERCWWQRFPSNWYW